MCNKGCGTKDIKADTGSALSHKFTNYVYQDDETCTADGTEKASCDNGCGTTDTREKAGTQLVDTILPTGKIIVKENSWKSFLNTITFGLFFDAKFDVTITGADNETGVKSIEYYKTSSAVDDITSVTTWTIGTSFSVESEGKYIIYAKITDNADNVLYISTDGLVIDTTKPVIEGITNGKTYCATQTFTVTDANLDYVKVNGTKTENFTLTNDEYTIVAVDRAGNSATVVVTVYEEHNFVNYVSNNDATCTTDGSETATCSHGCGQTDTRTDVGSKIPHKEALPEIKNAVPDRREVKKYGVIDKISLNRGRGGVRENGFSACLCTKSARSAAYRNRAIINTVIVCRLCIFKNC